MFVAMEAACRRPGGRREKNGTKFPYHFEGSTPVLDKTGQVDVRRSLEGGGGGSVRSWGREVQGRATRRIPRGSRPADFESQLTGCKAACPAWGRDCAAEQLTNMPCLCNGRSRLAAARRLGAVAGTAAGVDDR